MSKPESVTLSAAVKAVVDSIEAVPSFDGMCAASKAYVNAKKQATEAAKMAKQRDGSMVELVVRTAKEARDAKPDLNEVIAGLVPNSPMRAALGMRMKARKMHKVQASKAARCVLALVAHPEWASQAEDDKGFIGLNRFDAIIGELLQPSGRTYKDALKDLAKKAEDDDKLKALLATISVDDLVAAIETGLVDGAAEQAADGAQGAMDAE